MRLTWPLIGRADELQTIAGALSTDGVSGVVVRGAAGVGKSRIAKEALSVAAARGSEARWAVSTSVARDVPLGVFSAWTPSGPHNTVQLVRGVVEALTAAPSGVPVVLGVDDVHQLDDLSAFVLHQVVQRGAARVVLTVRDGASIPPAVQEIWSVGTFDELELRPLSPDETVALLHAVLGGAVAADSASRLWQLTRGNTLYLRHVVEREVADGRLAEYRGVWRWTGEPVMAAGLAELVEARIGELSAPVLDVLDVLAVGEPLELAGLVRLTDAAAVEEADERGLVSLDRSGRSVVVRLAHPLYGEVRRERAPSTRLRRLRGAVAADLATSDDGDDVRAVVRRAALSLESDLEPDADLLSSAAHGAVWLADLPLADRLADAAVRAGAGPQPNFVRAHALSWLGRGVEAESVLAGLPADDMADVDLGKLAFLRASNMLWALGDPVRAKEIIEGAALASGTAARPHLDAFLTVYWFALDRPDAALDASGRLVPGDIPVVGAEVAWALAQINAETGRTAEALHIAEAGHAVAARTLDAPHMRFNIADAEVTALLLAGRVAEALALAERTRSEADDMPGAAHLLGAAVAGRAALGGGDVHGACRLLTHAVDGLSETHAGGWGYRYRVAEATALAMRGACDDAMAALGSLDDVPRRFRALDFERSLARAWVAACRGAASSAVELVTAAAQRCRAAGRFAEEVMCLQTATQFGYRTGAARLEELSDVVEGPRAGVAARYATALRDGSGAELSALSEEFEAMGDLVAAVDTAAHAASAYRRRDKRGTALGCAARADGIAERCGVVTPALRQASETAPLTDRETEIVRLIGAGLSNRAVAEELVLLVRTVESHIYRAMAKTGAGSREELATLLRRPGPTK